MITQGDKIIKRDLYIETLPSKRFLATDPSGKAIEGFETGSFLFNINGIRTNGQLQSTIAAGTYKSVKIPYDWEIVSVNLNSDATGSIVIDIRKSTSEFPDAGDSICSATKPTLSSATAYSDSTLTGWDVDGNENDYLAVNVDSNDGCKNVILEVIVRKV